MFKMKGTKLICIENGEVQFTYDTFEHVFEFPKEPKVSIIHTVEGENESLAKYLENVKAMAARLRKE